MNEDAVSAQTRSQATTAPEADTTPDVDSQTSSGADVNDSDFDAVAFSDLFSKGSYL